MNVLEIVRKDFIEQTECQIMDIFNFGMAMATLMHNTQDR